MPRTAKAKLGPGVSTRAKDRSAPEEKSEILKMRREAQSLAEQVAALKEIIILNVKEEMQKKMAAQKEPPTKKTGDPQTNRGKEANNKKEKPSKTDERDRTAKPRTTTEETFPPMDATDANSSTWSKVIGRKARKAAQKGKKQGAQRETPSSKQQPNQRQKSTTRREPRKSKPLIRTPRRAAVSLTVAPGSDRTPEEVLIAARRKINLKDIGIGNVKIRFSVAVGILIEIPGKESAARADDLALRLKEIFPEKGDVRVARPFKKADIRLCGLDVSVQIAEVVAAVAVAKGCKEEEIKVGEIKKRSFDFTTGRRVGTMPSHGGQKDCRSRKNNNWVGSGPRRGAKTPPNDLL